MVKSSKLVRMEKNYAHSVDKNIFYQYTMMEIVQIAPVEDKLKYLTKILACKDEITEQVT